MTPLRWEDVAPDAAAFLAIVRGRYRPPSMRGLEEAARAAAARELPRAALADAVVAKLRALGAPAASLDAAERLRQPGVVTVVAGQQPVLFGGPHLIVTKALAAVAAARRVEASGRPCVPVFWVASEDHDHAEADHVSLVDRTGSLRTLRAELPRDGRMLSRVAIPDAERLHAALADALPDGPGREEALRAAAPEPGECAGDAFARTLLRLVGRFGMVVVDPETLRPFAQSVAEAEIGRPGRMAAAIAAAEDDLVRATGASPPLALRRPCLLYAVEDGVRVPVVATDGGVTVAGRSMTAAAALARARSEPRWISWNVAGRVVAQDVALPVAAQICGPAELVYAAVVAAAHAVVGVHPPALLPRPGVTWVEARALARCRALGCTPEDVVLGSRALAPDGLAPPPAVEEARRVLERLPEGSGPAVRRRRAGLLRGLELYAAATAREGREATAAADARSERVRAELRPRGGLQERELSILPFVARHGAAMLDRVLEIAARPGAEHDVAPAAGD